MRIRSDIVLFAALLAGSAYAVATQIGHDPLAQATSRRQGLVPFGGVLPEVTLDDWNGKSREITSLKGKVATVLYFVSIECPCVDAVQPRIQELMDDFGKRGVEFIGIDGHPDDTAKGVRTKAIDIHAMYRILLDPAQKLVRRLGVVGATDAVVLDAQGRLVYRGTIDDDLAKPTTPYLRPVLEALLAGKDPPFRESAKKPSYGCPFPGFDGVCPLD